MPEILNPFLADDAFTMASLTHSINILPNNYGRIREMGLFNVNKGITTRTAIVEEQHGVLTLLQTLPVGAPGQQNTMGKRKVRTFAVPHIPLDDVILPAEFQGIRAFGQESAVKTLAQVMNDHLQTAKNKFSITMEHLRMGAVKGLILDADGSLLFNLFIEFEIQQKSVDFLLGTAGTNIQAKCFEVSRHIEDNLHGEVMSKVHVLVSQEFFDDLIDHAEVQKVFLNHSAAVNALGGDPRKNFPFGGLTFEEYRGVATGAGESRRFINANEGHAFPLGTMGTFMDVYSPADFLETANTIGIPLYAKQEPKKFNRGLDLHIQSNPLPMCVRPGVLVKVFSSN